jgi:sirohydrochlorin cobaltochelatase
MGFRRIVVQPYLLFDGVLLKRVQESARRHSAEEPGVQFVTAGHLKNHPLLLQAFEDRAHEANYGSPLMNCDLCKYRVRLLGREADLGVPQQGHHHHVRAGSHPGDDHDHGPSRRRPSPVPRDEATSHPWDAKLIERLQLI